MEYINSCLPFCVISILIFMKLSNARTSIFLISLCSYYLYPSAAGGKLCIGAIPGQTEVVWRAQTKATKVIQKNKYKIL